jgi:NAD(P)-dependent dehydrogenase (short-subunit alcohol dehydrogenase family)
VLVKCRVTPTAYARETMLRLAGKTALITGATSGIGAATARRLLAEGANVLIGDLLEAGSEAITSAAPATSWARWILLDVTREDHWAAAVDFAVQQTGRLDILVNCAGRSSQVAGDLFGQDGWDSIMDVNAGGVFLGAKHAITPMRRHGGAIINIASIMALVGGEGGHPAYHASKGAVRALTKTFAVRYGRDGIRVNAIFPGFLPPMRTGRPIPPDTLERFVEWTPLGRTGTPEDIAAGVAFLASDDAAFITGAELVIDGGFVSR